MYNQWRTGRGNWPRRWCPWRWTLPQPPGGPIDAATAMGITDHIRDIGELLTCRPYAFAFRMGKYDHKEI